MELELKETAILNNVKNRVEHIGDERILAADIDLTINDIEAGELDQFALDGNMISHMFWDKGADKDLAGGYKLDAIKTGLLKPPFAINCIIDNHDITINIESADEHLKAVLHPIKINPGVIKKIKFTPKHNGYAVMTLQVAGNLNGKEIGEVLDKYLGERVSLLITPAANSQSTLLDESEGLKVA